MQRKPTLLAKKSKNDSHSPLASSWPFRYFSFLEDMSFVDRWGSSLQPQPNQTRPITTTFRSIGQLQMHYRALNLHGQTHHAQANLHLEKEGK